MDTPKQMDMAEFLAWLEWKFPAFIRHGGEKVPDGKRYHAEWISVLSAWLTQEYYTAGKRKS